MAISRRQSCYEKLSPLSLLYLLHVSHIYSSFFYSFLEQEKTSSFAKEVLLLLPYSEKSRSPLIPHYCLDIFSRRPYENVFFLSSSCLFIFYLILDDDDDYLNFIFYNFLLPFYTKYIKTRNMEMENMKFAKGKWS